jgi:hypothetical protein
LGRVHFNAIADRPTTVRFRLGRANRRLLSKRHHLPVTAAITATPTAGGTAISSRYRFTLKPARH